MNIPFKKTVLSIFVSLVASTQSFAQTEIEMNIEQPVANQINSGVSLIRGWAVHPTQPIISIESQIDDHSVATIPYGDKRGIVGQWYDGWVNSYESGFSTSVYWGNYSDGPHTLSVQACTSTECRTETIGFITAGYNFKNEWNDVPIIGEAVADGSRVHINNVQTPNGDYNIVLNWQFAANNWVIETITPIEDVAPPVQPGVDVEFMTLINDLRTSLGLQPVQWNNELALASQLHSQDMFDNDYFSHTGLDGSQFWERAYDAGFTGSPLGENIAWGSSTSTGTYDQWFNSPGHYANMTNSSATLMGLGKSEGGSRIYWTLIMGR